MKRTRRSLHLAFPCFAAGLVGLLLVTAVNPFLKQIFDSGQFLPRLGLLVNLVDGNEDPNSKPDLEASILPGVGFYQ